MLKELITWVLATAVPPPEAAHLAATAVGEPAMEEELLRICHRESRCTAVGIHARDQWASPTAWRAAVRVGEVDPTCQPYEPGEWSSRGAWGLLAAYQIKWLGVPCAQPWWLDVPVVSAWMAAKKLRDHCSRPKNKRHASTSRWGRCGWKSKSSWSKRHVYIGKSQVSRVVKPQQMRPRLAGNAAPDFTEGDTPTKAHRKKAGADGGGGVGNSAHPRP